MMNTQPAVPAVYVDPKYLVCARCGNPVEYTTRSPEAVGGAFSVQVWCQNDTCPCYNMVGDVPVTAVPGSKHRGRPAKKEASDAGA